MQHNNSEYDWENFWNAEIDLLKSSVIFRTTEKELRVRLLRLCKSGGFLWAIRKKVVCTLRQNHHKKASDSSVAEACQK